MMLTHQTETTHSAPLAGNEQMLRRSIRRSRRATRTAYRSRLA